MPSKRKQSGGMWGHILNRSILPLTLIGAFAFSTRKKHNLKHRKKNNYTRSKGKSYKKKKKKR